MSAMIAWILISMFAACLGCENLSNQCEELNHNSILEKNMTFCEDDPLLARILCPATCNYCAEYAEWHELLTPHPENCSDVGPEYICEQFVQDHPSAGGQDSPNSCQSSALARSLCPATCKHYKYECKDYLRRDQKIKCGMLANVCNDLNAAIFLCPEHCSLCEGHTEALTDLDCHEPACHDSHINCKEPGACDSPLAEYECLYTCFKCKKPVSTIATAKPTTAKPTTPKPITPKPATSKPITAKQTTQTTTTAEPTTPKPTTPTPTTPKPTTTKPTTPKPTTPKPTTAKPTTPKPTTPKPTTAKPTTPKPTTPKPTTAKPTTPEPTTPIPTTPKPTTAPTRPPKKCLQCGDLEKGVPCSDLELIVANTTLCGPDKPFCMNDIFQKGRDIQNYRRCVDEPTCNLQWYHGTSDNRLCLPFESSLAVDDLACHLCCYGHGCNIDDNPPKDLLYIP